MRIKNPAVGGPKVRSLCLCRHQGGRVWMDFADFSDHWLAEVHEMSQTFGEKDYICTT